MKARGKKKEADGRAERAGERQTWHERATGIRNEKRIPWKTRNISEQTSFVWLGHKVVAMRIRAHRFRHAHVLHEHIACHSMRRRLFDGSSSMKRDCQLDPNDPLHKLPTG